MGRIVAKPDKPANHSHFEFDKLMASLNYQFSNIQLLEIALTHPSANHDKTQNNERFEFFGDAILNFVITKELFRSNPKADEGTLTIQRSILVSRDTINNIAERLDLGSFIIMSEGETKSGGRKNSNNVGNAFEALIAAIYLDNDNDILAAEEVILQLWHPFLTQEFDLSLADPKSALQQYAQKNRMALPKYKLLERKGNGHNPLFTIELALDNGAIVTKQACNIKNAEKQAALSMLEKLRG